MSLHLWPLTLTLPSVHTYHDQLWRDVNVLIFVLILTRCVGQRERHSVQTCKWKCGWGVWCGVVRQAVRNGGDWRGVRRREDKLKPVTRVIFSSILLSNDAQNGVKKCACYHTVASVTSIFHGIFSQPKQTQYIMWEVVYYILVYFSFLFSCYNLGLWCPTSTYFPKNISHEDAAASLDHPRLVYFLYFT